jgi:hypothetical protein
VRLANRVVGWPQKALIGTFVGGLKEEIAAEVCSSKSMTLREAFGVVQMRDERLAKKKSKAKQKHKRWHMWQKLPNRY